MRKGKVFIDANIIIYAESFEKTDVFLWINDLYEDIYIHKTVLDELKLSSTRKKINGFITEKRWILFDPEDEETLSDALYDLYDAYVGNIHESFRQLNAKKIVESRELKYTNDLGEIHSLAAAVLLNAGIICSNDLDIREVIEDSEILITADDETESVLITQDTLEDFCFYVIVYEIAKRRIARTFFKTIHPDRVDVLDRRLLSESQTGNHIHIMLN